MRNLLTTSGKILLRWMFKAGRYGTGWGILQRSVYGLAVFVLLANDPGSISRLKAEIAAQVAAGGDCLTTSCATARLAKLAGAPLPYIDNVIGPHRSKLGWLKLTTHSCSRYSKKSPI